MVMAYTLRINGRVQTADVEADTPLLWVLRDTLGMVGTKFGCGAGLCGACTVHLDGVAVRSCQTPVSRVGAKAVTTIEGMAETTLGATMQKAWLDHDVMQCGYCQAGQIMSAASLLTKTPRPTDDQIERAMTGNICRCACYSRIRTAIRQAAGIDAPMAEAPSPHQVLATAAPSLPAKG
jgi:isoquinoline 1-oxidoreductase alpha subunit